MDPADLVNLIIAKLGGNRVEFIRISEEDYAIFVEFCHGGNNYEARVMLDIVPTRIRVYPLPPIHESMSYVLWMEDVLNGLVRNEAGEMVEAKANT